MDHVSDVNLTTFYEISRLHTLPEFAKQASVDREAVARLPNSSFADPVNRIFPCHTRQDTFLSYAYFLKNANQLPDLRRREAWNNLRKFANQWAIFADCETLRRAHEKQASEDLDNLDDDQFAIVEDYNGQKYRALPLLNSACVKAAAEHMSSYPDRYPLAWRKRASDRIARRAQTMQVEIEMPYIDKAAASTPTPNVDLARAMANRALLINREHHGEAEQIAMMKAAKAVASANGTPLAQKAAQIIDCFDDHYKLKRMYVRGLPTPEEICWGGLDKRALQLRDNLIQLTNGSSYAKQALLDVGLEPYRALGDDFVNAIRDGLKGVDSEKLAAIIPTLPLPDSNLLDRALRAVNIKTAGQLRKESQLPADISSWAESDWDRMIASLTEV